jgi:DNA-binding LacI/PurR family transcriptional regulator
MSVTKVAKLAKVSTATVSRVMNGHPSVDPKNVQRVKAAMKSLGYTPRAIRPGRVPQAQAKRQGSQTGVLGIVLMGRSQTIFENPYMARLLSVMTQTAKEEHRNLMIIEMPVPQELPRVLREKQVDGLILTGRPNFMDWVRSLGSIPSVVFGGLPMPGSTVDIVTNDSVTIGRMAAAYLLGKGCRRPAFVNHDAAHTMLRQRGEAFTEFVTSQGMPAARLESTVPESLDEDTAWSTDHMRRELGALIDRMLAAKQRPDGLFMGTDHQTMFVHSLLREKGVEPERDIRLVSCGNNEPWLAAMSPRPATIDIGALQEGRETVRRLIARIAHPYEDPVTILTTPKLIEGTVPAETKKGPGRQ